MAGRGRRRSGVALGGAGAVRGRAGVARRVQGLGRRHPRLPHRPRRAPGASPSLPSLDAVTGPCPRHAAHPLTDLSLERISAGAMLPHPVAFAHPTQRPLAPPFHPSPASSPLPHPSLSLSVCPQVRLGRFEEARGAWRSLLLDYTCENYAVHRGWQCALLELPPAETNRVLALKVPPIVHPFLLCRYPRAVPLALLSATVLGHCPEPLPVDYFLSCPERSLNRLKKKKSLSHLHTPCLGGP